MGHRIPLVGPTERGGGGTFYLEMTMVIRYKFEQGMHYTVIHGTHVIWRLAALKNIAHQFHVFDLDRYNYVRYLLMHLAQVSWFTRLYFASFSKVVLLPVIKGSFCIAVDEA